jgi:hypothetical protein
VDGRSLFEKADISVTKYKSSEVATKNRLIHHRDKAAEIIQKHKMLLLGDFWACRGAISGYFSRRPLINPPTQRGGPPSSLKVPRANERQTSLGLVGHVVSMLWLAAYGSSATKWEKS